MTTTVNIMNLWKTKVSVVVLLISLGHMSLSFSQDIDINALVQESQRLSESPDKMTLIWWTPEEFWQASLEQNPNSSPAEVEEILNVLRPYLMILAADGDIGPFAGITYKSRDIMQNSIQLVDREGTLYRPLSDEAIDPNTRNFLSMMGPTVANMLGEMGENMHFFLFPSKDEQGNNIAVAKEEGTFSIKLDEREFIWKLPLGSVLPPKVCPVDGEELNGAWKFCPWHGAELK